MSGPSPRGERFEILRAGLRVGAGDELRETARLLLEGAMADNATGIDDAQDVMAILRAAGRGDLDLADLLPEARPSRGNRLGSCCSSWSPEHPDKHL